MDSRGSEGRGGYWFSSIKCVELRSGISDEEEGPGCAGRVRSECRPGRKRTFTVCSTMLLRWPSANTQLLRRACNASILETYQSSRSHISHRSLSKPVSLGTKGHCWRKRAVWVPVVSNETRYITLRAALEYRHSTIAALTSICPK